MNIICLYRSGYYLGKYISLEAKIAKNKDLYYKVKQLLNKNKSERHIRGGMATKLKYMKK